MRAMKRPKPWTLVSAGVLGMGLAACELALDFDRTKIDAGGIDASFGDAVRTDQTAPSNDAPVDTANDAVDAPADASPEDASADALTDSASDASFDSGLDASADADAGADAADDG